MKLLLVIIVAANALTIGSCVSGPNKPTDNAVQDSIRLDSIKLDSIQAKIAIDTVFEND